MSIVNQVRVSLLLLIALLGLPPAGHAASITLMGDLPFGQTHSAANALSADGTTLAGTSAGGQFRAVRQTIDGELLDFGSLFFEIGTSVAFGISGDGSIVVGQAATPNGTQAFIWSEGDDRMRVLDEHPDPVLNSRVLRSRAWGISADGSTIVGDFMFEDSGGLSEAAVWRGNGFEPLPLAGGQGGSVAFDVSADGRTIVGLAPRPILASSFAAMWVDDGEIEFLLDTIEHDRSGAAGVSADGGTVVGFMRSGDTQQAFRWSRASGAIVLDDLPGGNTFSLASAISSNGSVIVGSSQSEQGGEAVVWSANGEIDTLQILLTAAGVDLSDWLLVEAIDVSADGTRIAGNGFYRGSRRGFLAVIPEPSTALLLGVGLVGLGARQRKD